MLDRLDDTIEPIARIFGGKALWDEMKENATMTADRAAGAARMTATHLLALLEAGLIDEIHLAGHSAGAVLLAPLAKYLASKKVKIKSLSLWAPACTMQLFEETYRPLIASGDIEAFDLCTLDDATERDDDCANIYHKSLLYLVSGAFEAEARMPLIGKKDGTPLLGLARDAAKIPKSFWTKKRRWIVAPGDPGSQARHHGDFDNDKATLLTALRRITGQADLQFPEAPGANASAAGIARRRRRITEGLARA
jgi:pimeloyl-ACP methyl ester carboxylesterase